jgi:DNA-binding transcriptional LysR family regulator
VIRHIDALEKRLGSKLFQRHARGYTPTESGRDLLAVAQTTEEQFGQLASRIKGQGEEVAGEMVVTAITGIADLLTPVLAAYQEAHPKVVIRFLTDMRVFRLDYGEAHVAIRAGEAPQEPDNVVQSLGRMKNGLYASRSYIAAHGMPGSLEELVQHRFIGPDQPDSRAPFYRWLRERVAPDRITLRITEPSANLAALEAGMGLAFCNSQYAATHPELVEVMAPIPEWEAPLWIVTHVDLHRTRKVQAFVSLLKETAKAWPQCTGAG